MAGIEPLTRLKKRKKKIFIIFLYLSIVIFSASKEVASQINCDSLQCRKGDLNGDSIFTPADVVLELNCVFIGTGPCDTCLVDVNCDGTNSPADIVIELNAVFLNSPIDNISYPVIVDADSSGISDSLRQVYWDDAEILTIRTLEQAGGCARKRAMLPDELVRSIYNALIHVHNATGLAARDSVVSMYCIHAFGLNRQLAVYVDTSYAWVQAWRRGERFTGNPEVDVLMECFDLHLTYFYPFVPFAYLRSLLPIYPRVLAEKFRRIEGVRYASDDCCVGDGDDIALEIGENFLQLNYIDGYGDCPAGCTGRHIWSFKVYTDGIVEYVGNSGDPTAPPCCRCFY